MSKSTGESLKTGKSDEDVERGDICVSGILPCLGTRYFDTASTECLCAYLNISFFSSSEYEHFPLLNLTLPLSVNLRSTSSALTDQGDSVLTLTFAKSGLDALLCLEGNNEGLLPLALGEFEKQSDQDLHCLLLSSLIASAFFIIIIIIIIS